MKNIRSISIAILFLFLSTATSNGLSFNSLVTASKDAFTSFVNTSKEQLATVCKTAVETVHPYISAAATLTFPISGYAYTLYKGVFAKRLPQNDKQIFSGLFAPIVETQKANITKAAARMAVAKANAALKPETEEEIIAKIKVRAKKIVKTIIRVANQGGTFNETQVTEMRKLLSTTLESIKQLPKIDFKHEALNFGEVVVAWTKSDKKELKTVNSAMAKIDPTYDSILMEKIVVASSKQLNAIGEITETIK